MENKLKKIMSDIFEVELSSVSNESSIENTNNWNSLRHINLITKLEKEFEIDFSPAEVVKLISFELILEKLKKEL